MNPIQDPGYTHYPNIGIQAGNLAQLQEQIILLETKKITRQTMWALGWSCSFWCFGAVMICLFSHIMG